MNTLKMGYQENVCRNQQQPWQMGICVQEMEVGSQQESYDQPANSSSSSTIMHRIGSPASAFYAAEKYMGFSQYDHQPASNPIPVSKKFEPQISLYQQSGNGYYRDPSLDQVGTGFQAKRAYERPPSSSIDHYYSSYDKSSKIPCNIVSEREKILELKRKLLDDYDSSDTRQLPSFSYDGNHDLCVSRVSENVYGSQHAHVRPIGRPSGPFSVNSASPGAVIESKTRIRWTQELHDQFVECVNCLGGAEKATPKAILKLMDSGGLTIFHVKSHLQKYRIAKYMPDSAKGKTDKRTSMSSVEEIDNKTGMQIKEALQMQLDVQRRLHEQLEIQRNLQLRIEEQGRQLKKMLDQQQKTTKSFMETQNSENTSPDDQQSTSLEDVQVLNVEVIENTNLPSKIS